MIIGSKELIVEQKEEIMSLINVYRKIKNAYLHLSEKEALTLALYCNSYSDDDETGLKFLDDNFSDDLSFEMLTAKLWEVNSHELKSKFDPQLKTLGIWANEQFIESQFSDIAEAVGNNPRYSCLTILSADYLNLREKFTAEQICHKLAPFEKFHMVFIPDNSVVSEWSFLDLVFAVETRGGERTSFPRRTKRVVQAHGLDNNFLSTVFEYSGGSSYSYVLSTKPLVGEIEQVTPHTLMNIFPRELIEHDDTFVCAVPMGYPKVDHFMEKLREKGEFTPDRIIYNLSVWAYESPMVRSTFESTLELLLREFPEYDIVFRPYPFDMAVPEIKKAIERFSPNNRFILSTADSYIDDYLTGALIISHRGSSAEVFSYATGRPSLRYLPNSSDCEELELYELGYGARNEANFLATLRHILSDPDQDRERIFAERDLKLVHPGYSVNYLIENLDFILEERRHPEWKYYELFDPEESAPDVRDDYVRSCEKNCSLRLINLAVADCLVERFPDDPLFLFYKGVIYRFYAATFVYYWSFTLDYIAESLFVSYKDLEKYQSVYDRAVLWFLQHGITTFLSVKKFYEINNNPAMVEKVLSTVQSLFKLPELTLTLFNQLNNQQNEINRLELELKTYTDYIDSNKLKGIEALDSGHCADAVLCFQKNLEIIPNEKDSLYNMALAGMISKDYSSGISSIMKLLILEPENYKNWVLWEKLITCRKPEDIRVYVRILLNNFEVFPENEEIVLLLCKLAAAYRLNDLAQKLLTSVEQFESLEMSSYVALLKNI